MGVEVEVVALLHAGISRSVPLSTNRASSPHAFRDRFPPAAAPRPARASIGNGSQSAQKCAEKLRGGITDPVVTTGPEVLMVSCEVLGPSAVTVTVLGLNEQIGGMVTKGVIELHDSVTPGVGGLVTGVAYPLMGLMLITATPLLPAGTLPGCTAFSTVMVNCGVTSSTVMYKGCVVVVWLLEAAVPVMVTPYLVVVVPVIVVMVAEALAGGVTLSGLTVHTGASTIVCACAGATWQVRSTLPLKPFTVPTAMFAEDVPPGSTATSDSEGACSVKFCAEASAGKARKTASRHNAEMTGRSVRTISLGFEDSNCNGSVLNHSDCGNRDFNMSRFWFK